MNFQRQSPISTAFNDTQFSAALHGEVCECIFDSSAIERNKPMIASPTESIMSESSLS